MRKKIVGACLAAGVAAIVALHLHGMMYVVSDLVPLAIYILVGCYLEIIAIKLYPHPSDAFGLNLSIGYLSMIAGASGVFSVLLAQHCSTATARPLCAAIVIGLSAVIGLVLGLSVKTLDKVPVLF